MQKPIGETKTSINARNWNRKWGIQKVKLKLGKRKLLAECKEMRRIE